MIVGGGIVGATLACALAEQTPLSIAVIENKSSYSPWQASQLDARVSAVTLASKRIFEGLHIWEDLCAKRVSPFNQILVWDDVSSSSSSSSSSLSSSSPAQHAAPVLHFDSADIRESVLGYIIENNAILTTLHERMQQFTRITYFTGTNLQSMQREDCHIQFKTANGDIITTPLAVAADGANSWLRQQCQFNLKVAAYEQHAIVTHIETEKAHDKIARQVFLPSGPLAYLPLSQSNQCSLVWSLPNAQVQSVLSLDEDAFKSHLAAAASPFGLGEVVNCSPRFNFPLLKQHTDRYIQNGVVLVGDAAHTVHPLAGLGLNMGLLDAACLTQVVSEAVEKKHTNYAATSVLRRYERWRKADNATLLIGIDLLKRVFADNHTVIKLARSFGLQTTHRWQFLRNYLMRFAVGNRNHLPELACKRYTHHPYS